MPQFGAKDNQLPPAVPFVREGISDSGRVLRRPRDLTPPGASGGWQRLCAVLVEPMEQTMADRVHHDPDDGQEGGFREQGIKRGEDSSAGSVYPLV